LKVASNKGAPGADGQTTWQLLEQWPTVLPRLSADLLEGRYRPGEIRQAYIPKAGGGQRGLGIPDVVDRVVQEAVRRVLEPLWEPTLHPSSHGFRPAEVVTRRSPRPRRISRTAMSGWWILIW
jgi:retron-type reverse transcriptase